MNKNKRKQLIKENQSVLNSFLIKYSNAIINEEASLFIGTGVSMNSYIPSWSKLLSPCFDELEIDIKDNISLYKVAQYYTNKHNLSDLLKIVNKQINQYFPENDVLKSLLRMRYKSIWTTNYDHLIEDELSRQKLRATVFINEQDFALAETAETVCVYKMNGDFNCPSTIVLTQDEYERYADTHSLFLTFLKKELVSNTFLFAGYSFEDQIVLDCLSSTMKLLSGNGNLHYAFIFLDDSTPDSIQLKAEDLKKRYNIECIYVDKDFQTEVIHTLIKYVNKNKIFISGAYYNVTPEEDAFADKLSECLTRELLSNDMRISTGVGRKLGTYITGYANQFLAEHSMRNTHKYLSMRPFPFHRNLSEKEKEDYRKFMQHDCSCAIFMFGQSEHEKNSEHISQGVYQEFCIAQELGLNVIPVGSTGYETAIIAKEVANRINEFPYLSKKIKALCSEKDPQKLTKIILSICNQDK